MIKQMAAERSKRAMILEAEGKKQAAILEAEGYKDSVIKRAEGDRQAAILEAEGRSRALEMLNDVAQKLTPNMLMLQYLDALKSVAQAPSTKIVLPLEITKLFEPLGKVILRSGE